VLIVVLPLELFQKIYSAFGDVGAGKAVVIPAEVWLKMVPYCAAVTELDADKACVPPLSDGSSNP
jgi:hypothetical protein